MSLKKNKALMRRWVEADNKRDLTVLDELLAEDYLDPSLQVRGRESYKQRLTMIFKGFPNYHETIKDIIAEGDKVWVLWKVTGTHTGEFEWLGSTFSPTGKKIAMTAAAIWRIVDGKFTEKKSGVVDFLDFYEKLSVIKYTEKGKNFFRNV
jgi:predicted ester cyclase